MENVSRRPATGAKVPDSWVDDRMAFLGPGAAPA